TPPGSLKSLLRRWIWQRGSGPPVFFPFNLRRRSGLVNSAYRVCDWRKGKRHWHVRNSAVRESVARLVRRREFDRDDRPQRSRLRYPKRTAREATTVKKISVCHGI